MNLLKRLEVPNTFDSDDFRFRRILNIVLLSLVIVSFGSLVSVFSYGDPFLETLTDERAQMVILPSALMVLVCVGLIIMNRSTRIPKSVVGWVLVAAILAGVSVSDSPQELSNGGGLIFWFLPVILSVVILPPVSVFLVDAIVFVLIVSFSPSLEQTNIYAIFLIAVVSVLAWLGMSIANRALLDARNEAEKNHAILNGVADGVVVLNDKDQVVMTNPVALVLLGNELAEFKPAMEDDRKEIGGRVLSLHWSKVREVGNVAIVRDISRQVEVERAKDAILGVVSHEMRTPLAAILGFSEVLRATASSQDVVERIYVNAKRMMTLVDDLLDHAQIQAGTLKMRREHFSPSAMANNVFEMFSGRAKEGGIDLRFDVAETMPVTLVGDSNRYQQILINLVANAIKFTSKGGEVKVSIVPKDQDAWLMIVCDTGIGIPPERLPDIFEAFRRASDYATRQHQGAGLGLSIAQKITRLAGGNVRVESVVGQGSMFTVTLPNEIGAQPPDQKDNP